MTEQTLEEQASQAFARAFACVFPLPLTVRSEQTDAAVAFIADFARAHAERETAAHYERDFKKFAELERKRIVEIVDLKERVRQETERADVAEQSEAELTQACKDLDAQIVDLRAELATVTKDRDTVLFDARTKNVVEVAEFAALRARLERLEKAADVFKRAADEAETAGHEANDEELAWIGGEWDDEEERHSRDQVCITLGDLRALRDAIGDDK